MFERALVEDEHLGVAVLDERGDLALQGGGIGGDLHLLH